MMNVLKRFTTTTMAMGLTGAVVGTTWLCSTTTLITPLPANDPLWKSASFKTANQLGNPALTDIAIKRVSLSIIRPELREDPEKLATAFTRGVWTGWAFEPQRWLFQRIFRTPQNAHLRFSRNSILGGSFNLGDEFLDQFEIIDKTRTSISVREGGSPRDSAPRELDGLIITTAVIDKVKGEVELTLKTALVKGNVEVKDGTMPVPFLVEVLHRLYARALVVSGAQALR